MTAPVGSAAPRSRAWPLWVAVLATAVVASIAMAGAAPFSTAQRHGPWMPWVVAAAGIVAGSRLRLSVRSRGVTLNIGAESAAITAALLFVPPSRVALAIGVATVAGELLARRSPYSAAYNAAISLIGAGAAMAVAHAALGAGSPVSLRGGAAAVAATVALDGVTGVLVLAHVAACRAGLAGAARTITVHSALGMPVTVVATLATVSLLWIDRWHALLAAAVGGLLAYALRRTGALQARVDTLERVGELTTRLSELHAEADVVVAALSEVRTVLGASVAELAVGDPADPTGATVVCTRLDVDGTVSATRRRWRPVEIAARHDGPTLAAAGRRRHAAALDGTGWRDALAVPADVGGGAVLTVADRLGPGTFGRGELTLLAALARQAGMAVTRSRLEGVVAEEAAARHRAARTDELTGLGNRTLLRERLAVAVAAGEVGVVVLDLDRFRDVNDTLGHHVGDEVLRQVASRVSDLAERHGGVACRLGGDEFALMVPGRGPDVGGRVAEVAAALVDAVGLGMTVAGLSLDVHASVGYSLAPAHGDDPALLLRQADVAMYLAKSNGGGACGYDGSLDTHSTRNLRLAAELRTALRTEQLDLWLQPKADLATGRVVGAEALLRWQHPEFGWVPPDEFIGVAERSGLINELTWWVVDRAVAHLQAWAAAGLDLGIAVNISARDLHDTTLADALAVRLARAGVAAGRLTLEVTESCVMADPGRSQQVLGDLARLGLRLSIDDFGTGYSSLTRLQTLPIDEVKVDRSFVRDLPGAAGDSAIVRSVVDLARNLGLTVVAEGIETDDAWQHLQALGCPVGQGYHLAKPMPADAFDRWLRHRSGVPAA